MASEVFNYNGEHIEVSWDKNRCIHAKECVNNLPGVFDIKKKPWIQPDQASPDEVAKIIQRCPTGALLFKRLDDGSEEAIPAANTITLVENGPAYLEGNLVISNHEGTEIARETRAAFCRCGASQNKPYCDNSHLTDNFTCGVDFNPERLLLEATDETGNELHITLFPNAPFVVEGNYKLIGGDQQVNTEKKMSFCRCGGSMNKPFCDGSHKQIGFTTE
ncbi:MAG: CDGSH iron-sulfur domain-containing protein [Bacteroidota bacterium]